MAKKSGRPFWFKIDMSIKPLLDAVPDENAGRAIKAALEYFETRQSVFPNDDDPLTLAPFIAMKTAVDDAYSEYEQRIENGKKGGRPRQESNTNHCLPTQTNTNHVVTNTNHKVTEEEVEEEIEKELEEDLSFREKENDLSLPDSWFQKSDSIEIRREKLASVGLGIVIINDEQLKELYDKLSLTDFEHYVGVIRDCVNKGRRYTRKTHAQAILDMAKADGKLITEQNKSSFDVDDFFEAAVRKSYKDFKGNNEFKENEQ